MIFISKPLYLFLSLSSLCLTTTPTNVTQYLDELDESITEGPLLFENYPWMNLSNLIVPEPPNPTRITFVQHRWTSAEVFLFLALLLLLSYMVTGEIVVCREFFVPSILTLAEEWKISSDTAGGTVMALGCVMPLLFLNLLNVPNSGLKPFSNMNITVAIAASCFFRKRSLEIVLSWWSLNRGVIFYSAFLMATFCLMVDEVLFWYDAFIMIICFFGYCLFMYYDERLRSRYFIKTTDYSRGFNGEETALYYNQTSGSGTVEGGQEITMYSASTGKDFGEGLDNPSFSDKRDLVENENVKNASCVATHTADGVTSGTLQGGANVPLDGVLPPAPDQQYDVPLSMAWPDTLGKRINYILLLPVRLPVWVTLPDVRIPEKRCRYAFTYVGSVLWILAYNYVLANIFQVKGWSRTGIPLVTSSVLVVRRGLGDMAVSAIYGSSIMELTLGFPLPCLISCFIQGYVDADSNFVFVFVPILFQLVLFAYLYFASRTLNSRLGCVAIFLPLVTVLFLFMLMYVGTL